MEQLVQKIFQGAKAPGDWNNQLFHSEQDDGLRASFEKVTTNCSPELKKRIEDEIFHWGPLQNYFQKDGIFELIINGPHHLYFEDQQGLKKIKDQFISEISFRNFFERICQQSNIIVSQKSPFSNGCLDLFRVHIAIPPTTSSIHMTFRRHRRTSFSLNELWEQNFISEEQWCLLQKILDDKKNFLVIGPTGSGKTTLVASLLKEMPQNERMLIIEDTDELSAPNPLSCKLLSRELCPDTLDKIYLEDLVKQSLRMRPDRIVVGEVRGKEAKDLLMALATGHSGSMGTLHARTAAQGLYRLEMLIQMGAPQWNLQAIRQLIHMSLDYLIVLDEDRLNKKVEGIYRIASHEKFGILLEKKT